MIWHRLGYRQKHPKVASLIQKNGPPIVFPKNRLVLLELTQVRMPTDRVERLIFAINLLTKCDHEPQLAPKPTKLAQCCFMTGG
jgi:hypothetical protein